MQWLEDSCQFANTLVARIVTGYPTDEADRIFEALGYTDSLLTTCEPFSFFAIEGDPALADRFPARKVGFDVVVEPDINRYRMRKVRLLNGSHTSIVAAGYLAGHDTVLSCISDPLFKRYLERVLSEEIIPNVPMDPAELLDFKDSILDRFLNPSIQHRLLDISLHSISKFTVRLLPSLESALTRGGQAPLLSFAFASLIEFYKVQLDGKGGAIGRRGSETYPVRDDESILAFFANLWSSDLPSSALVTEALSNTSLWGKDLSGLPHLAQQVSQQLDSIEKLGITQTLHQLLP